VVEAGEWELGDHDTHQYRLTFFIKKVKNLKKERERTEGPSQGY
jgi:hypothetical protein